MMKTLTFSLFLAILLGLGWILYSSQQIRNGERILPVDKMTRRLDYFIASPPPVLAQLADRIGDHLDINAGRCFQTIIFGSSGSPDIGRFPPIDKSRFIFFKPVFYKRSKNNLGLVCEREGFGKPFTIEPGPSGAYFKLERYLSTPLRFNLINGNVIIKSDELFVEVITPGIRAELKSQGFVNIIFSVTSSTVQLSILSGKLHLDPLPLAREESKGGLTLPIQVSTTNTSELWSRNISQASNGESVMLFPSGFGEKISSPASATE